jgi:lysophospholipase L1-like esterase
LATQTGAFKSELSKDGVHPNAQGYKLMEPLARAAIDSELGKK